MKTLALLTSALLLLGCTDDGTPPDGQQDAGDKTDAGPQGPYPWTPDLVDACQEYCDAVSFAQGCPDEELKDRVTACRFGCDTKLDQVGLECADRTRFYYACLASDLWLCPTEDSPPEQDTDHCTTERSNLMECLAEWRLDSGGMPAL